MPRAKKRVTVALQEQNWELWQSRVLRSRWLTRFKKSHPNVPITEVPTAKQIEAWLHTLDFTCYFTGVRLLKGNINYDHIQPVKRNGSFALSNIATVTPEINKIKGEMSEAEFRSLLQLLDTWEDRGQGLKATLKRATLVFAKKSKF